MRLAHRIKNLEAALPPVRTGRAVPTDPVAFARGLLTGALTVADLDRTDPHQMGCAVRVSAFLGTLTPEHQEWLRRERAREPGAYPDALLLPVAKEQVWAALDAVMRRG